MGNRGYFYRIKRDSETNELTFSKIWNTGKKDVSEPLLSISLFRTFRYPQRYTVTLTDYTSKQTNHQIYGRIELVGVHPHFEGTGSRSLDSIDFHWHRQWLQGLDKVVVLDIYDLREARLPQNIVEVIQLS